MSGPTSSAWWQLLRAGNVFTAISNILAGFLLAHGEWRGEWQSLLPLVLLALASAALYLAGMVLNDVFDLELDRVERPERPLPSGLIKPSLAKIVGWGLLIDGLLAAGVAAWLLESWSPLVMACLLAAAIVGYDAILKKSTRFGPSAMGLCRSLNVLLGASIVAHSPEKNAAYAYAAALGIYTIGLTLLAKNEAGESTGDSVKFASIIVQVGLLALLPIGMVLLSPRTGWLAVWLMSFLVARVVLYEAFITPTPSMVRRSVSRLITMFIVLDALVCVAAAGWIAGFCVLALLIPTYVATRRVTMT